MRVINPAGRTYALPVMRTCIAAAIVIFMILVRIMNAGKHRPSVCLKKIDQIFVIILLSSRATVFVRQPEHHLFRKRIHWMICLRSSIPV